MPGQSDEAAEIFRWLAEEISPDTYLNIMGQYRPEYEVGDFGELEERHLLRSDRQPHLGEIDGEDARHRHPAADELSDVDTKYLMVNEAGASVYSTSMVGVEELPGGARRPDFDGGWIGRHGPGKLSALHSVAMGVRSFFLVSPSNPHRSTNVG